MRYLKAITLIITIALYVGLWASCSVSSENTRVYDPAKNYASFLVLDSDTGKSILETLKQRSIAEGNEVGPVEFYKIGTKDFEPALKKLTPSPQIKIIWISSSLMDIPDIQKAVTKIEYKGMLRYMPVSGTPSSQ